MRELISKFIVLLTSVFILLFSVFFALSQNRGEAEAQKSISPEVALQEVVLDSRKIREGKKLFREHGCMKCHSIEGRGNRRDPLDGVGSRLDKKALEDWTVGADSLEDMMSRRAFMGKQKYKQLEPDELESLVEYMQSLR